MHVHKMNQNSALVLSSTVFVTEEGRGERKQLESFLRPNWSVHYNFSGDSNSEYVTVAVQARFLDKDTKKFFSSYSIFSTILYCN
jgi:hypothetical protein